MTKQYQQNASMFVNACYKIEDAIDKFIEAYLIKIEDIEKNIKIIEDINQLNAEYSNLIEGNKNKIIFRLNHPTNNSKKNYVAKNIYIPYNQEGFKKLEQIAGIDNEVSLEVSKSSNSSFTEVKSKKY
jgi:hypothetical protein